MSPLEYFAFATLPFSTVLPAVISTEALLAEFPRLTAGLDNFVRIDLRRSRAWSIFVLALACAALVAVGIVPNILFPMLWLAPLFVILPLQIICGRPSIIDPLAHGDWSRVCRLALAALICGFFWELWNYGSLAHWEYLIPYVGRFHVFEMPILGYAGYLPFGIECGLISDLMMCRFRGKSRACAT